MSEEILSDFGIALASAGRETFDVQVEILRLYADQEGTLGSQGLCLGGPFIVGYMSER